MVDDDDDCGDGVPEHEELIDLMAAFADGLPVTAVLAPFRGNVGAVVGVELTDLYADQPGKGVGTTYMTKLVEEAERLGVAIYLRPDSPRSKAFYERFEFGMTSRIHGGMARLPSPPSWVLSR